MRTRGDKGKRALESLSNLFVCLSRLGYNIWGKITEKKFQGLLKVVSLIGKSQKHIRLGPKKESNHLQVNGEPDVNIASFFQRRRRKK